MIPCSFCFCWYHPRCIWISEILRALIVIAAMLSVMASTGLVDTNIALGSVTRVEATRAIQRRRFAATELGCNAGMTPGEVREYCPVEESAQGLLKAAMKQLYLSARAFHRILKLARTIADLGGDEIIKAHHLAEAIQYRPRRTQ